MKKMLIPILLISIYSCSKSPSIIETNSSTNDSDSAKLFLITASSNSSGTSMMAYDNNKLLKWEQNSILPISFWSMPTYGDNRLFYSLTNKLVSINSNNGSNYWTYTSPVNIINPKIKNDTIITATSIIGPSNQNSIILLNKLSGNVIWSKIINDQPIITPFLDGNKIFVLTTNSNGTAVKLSSYDINTYALIWQKTLANAFLMTLPSDIIIRNDTLIIGSPSNQINVINKNTGSLYWSKSLNATNVFLDNNRVIYNDLSSGCLTLLSLQNGTIIFQSAPSNAVLASSGNKLSYVYKDAIYFQSMQDTLYCTNLVDGLLKWKKPYRGFYQKIVVIGKYAYGLKLYDNTLDELKLMIINASDFTIKDSIIVPKRDYKNFSIISSSNEIF